MVGADHLVKLVKLKVEVIEYVPEPRKVMLTVLVQLKSRNVKTHHVQMPSLGRNGSAVALNL